jgi:hypothetical protein
VTRAIDYLVVFGAGVAVGTLTALMIIDANLRSRKRRGGYLP